MMEPSAASSRPLRVLVCTESFPWPATSGFQRRMIAVLEGLAQVGVVDLWSTTLDLELPTVRVAPAEARIARVRVTPPVRRRTARGRFVRWCCSRWPRGQLDFDGSRARADLVGWASDTYDLVWCCQLRTYSFIAGALRAPVVLDLADLGDAMLSHRRRARGASGGNRVRGLIARAADVIDARRYERLHRRITREVAAVVVCSDLDRLRLAAPNVEMVPNTYPAPEPPAVLRVPDATAVQLLMVGLFAYGPNRDAARFFVEEVLPLVRDELPGTRLRLVGRQDGSLDDLLTAAGVDVVGEVAHVGPELERASAVVVPVRYGGGTRVKILEAFAYRVPVVATTVGCEGLEVTSGQHLLIADAPAAFAAACVSAVRDPMVRTELTDAAFELFEQKFRPEVAARAVAEIANRVASSASAQPPVRAGQ